MMDVIAVLLVVVGFAIGWCLRGCHEDEKAAQRIERAKAASQAVSPRRQALTTRGGRSS
jgi:3-methyladenine DNA glycosylase AlkD